jgi:hypothetical protein
MQGMQRTHPLFDGSSIFKGMKIMKTITRFACALASIAVTASLQPAYSAESAGSLAFIESVNSFKPGGTSFSQDPQEPLQIQTRHGKLPIVMMKKTDCNPKALSNVYVVLSKYPGDMDVEIPRISLIYYDSCKQTIIQNGGNIEIPNMTGTVGITFQLHGFSDKTKWKKLGGDSVFVGHAATAAVPPPTSPGTLPCNAPVKKRTDTTISFDMCATNNTGKDLFYGYALHLDQIGSDGIGIDIGIDPQIINHPAPGRPPPP